MYKTIFNKRNSLKFNRFSNKNYSLFAVLGREVLVGALSVATLSHAKAAGVSTEGAKVDSTLYKGGKAYELDAVSVTGSRAPMTVEQSPKIVSVITRDDIHRAAAQTINDVLKLATGVDVRQRGGFGSDGYLHQWWNLRPDYHSLEWCQHFQSTDWSQCF
jgi:vitamin B12 transporter